MRLLAAPEDQPDLTPRAQPRHLDGDELAARDFGQRAAARQHGDAHAHLDRALDAVEARQRDLNIDRRVAALVGAEDAVARRRRIVVRDHRLLADLFDRRPATRGERVLRMRQHHQLVGPSAIDCSPRSAGLEREDAEVEIAVEQLGRDRARADAAHLDERMRMRLGEAIEKRQQRVHRGFVGADNHSTAPDLLQLAHGGFGVGGQAQQPRRHIPGGAGRPRSAPRSEPSGRTAGRPAPPRAGGWPGSPPAASGAASWPRPKSCARSQPSRTSRDPATASGQQYNR